MTPDGSRPVVASVVVPAKDAAATLPRALACLVAQQLEDGFEVIVVDDGSIDETPQIVEAAGPPVRLVSGAGLGAADARNRGVAAAAGDVLAFTDADCFAPPGWLAAGLDAMREADLIQGAVEPDPDTPPAGFDHTIVVPSRSALFETANLFVTRELFERVGGFEEIVDAGRAQGRFGEDAWFGWRATRTGARTGFATKAVTYHARIRRSGREFVAERRRLRHFPALLVAIPEIRARRSVGWIFLSSQTAAFDIAVAGVFVAATTRSRLPLLAAAPYAASLKERVGTSRWAPRLAAVELAADAIGLVALMRGSLEARTLLL